MSSQSVSQKLNPDALRLASSSDSGGKENLFTYRFDVTLQDISQLVAKHAQTASKELDECQVDLDLTWELIQGVYNEMDSVVHLLQTLTFTGDADAAVALSCTDYVHEVWGGLGVAVLNASHAEILNNKEELASVDSLRPKVTILGDDTRMEHKLTHGMDSDPECGQIKVIGPREQLVEVAQILCWTAATFRNAAARPLSASTLAIKASGSLLSITLQPLRPLQKSLTSCNCWMGLLNLFIIAVGLLPAAPDHEGLRIALQIMGYLGGMFQAIYLVNPHVEDSRAPGAYGIILRGINCFMYPVTRFPETNTIQWHYEEMQRDEAATQMLFNRSWYKIISEAELESSKCILG